MTAGLAEKQKPVLKIVSQQTYFDLKNAMAWVKIQTKKGRLRQIIEMTGLAIGRQKLSPEEYYVSALWRPHLSADEKAAYLSESSSYLLNKQLSPVTESGLQGLCRNKILTGLVLRAAGFPALQPLAVFGGQFAVPGTVLLSTAADIVDWLQRDGQLPVFGKAINGSLSIGAASYMNLTEDRNSVVLGNGTVVALSAIAAEIVTYFATGYMFEPLIRQHPTLATIAGKAVGALRVVTLRGPDGPEVLYVAQRLPGVGAMMDASTVSPYTMALVDPATGRIIRAQSRFAMNVKPLEASLVTGVRFDTVVLPFIAEAMAISVDVHRLFGTPGILGFDIALTTTGVLINEVNSNPFHSTYQHAADRGLMNPDFRPRIEAAIKIAKAV